MLNLLPSLGGTGKGKNVYILDKRQSQFLAMRMLSIKSTRMCSTTVSREYLEDSEKYSTAVETGIEAR
jgi:hypothetical protein